MSISSDGGEKAHKQRARGTGGHPAPVRGRVGRQRVPAGEARGHRRARAVPARARPGVRLHQPVPDRVLLPHSAVARALGALRRQEERHMLRSARANRVAPLYYMYCIKAGRFGAL